MVDSNYNLIVSRDNAQVKQIVKLATDSKARNEISLAVIYGEHLLVEAIKHKIVKQVFVAIDSLNRHEKLLSKIPKAKINLVSREVIKKINILESAVELVAVIAINHQELDLTAKLSADCLVLEQIQDPGNLGTILRAAYASGIKHVILSLKCVDPYNPKVLRASQGVQFGLKIYTEVDISEFIANYGGQILGLSPHATASIYEVNLTENNAFIFGNEGSGLSAELLKQIPQQVMIPMQGNTESLNLAMAVTVTLFEMSRQRSKH